MYYEQSLMILVISKPLNLVECPKLKAICPQGPAGEITLLSCSCGSPADSPCNSPRS